MMSMNELPKEVTFPPVPYIALIGLDAASNTYHNQVWNTFAINRAVDRPPLYYKLIPIDHSFIPAKVKKTYDRYVPSGILKTNWFAKHLFEIPSVAVVFEEADWHSLQNTDQRMKCIEKVKRVRTLLNGRHTKIVLILLQSEPITHSDDQTYKENVGKLCLECDINPKSFFIIPINELQLMLSYVQRIEQIILDLAKNYYVAQTKSVKSHKEQLNKSTQIYLYIRHEFKLGFFHEIRQIYNTALGHYKNAYVSLMEIRTNPLNIFEVKSMASLLNYKICRLCFYLNVPMDAISNFRKHVDIFQNKQTTNQGGFEQFAWLSEQFQIFAELFEMAVNSLSLAPSSNHHPGVYFFEAASYMSERRKAARSIDVTFTKEEAAYLSAITNVQNREFVGQFAWNSDLSDTDKIKFANMAIQFNESQVDHTKLLINLYGNVLNQIRKFKKPRFSRYLMYLIGEEYFNLNNYEEALTYFCNILQYYREEKWNDIYFKVINLAMISAYRLADISNFIRFGFEQMSNSTITDQDRKSLMNCLDSFLNLQYSPLSDNCQIINDQNVMKKWTDILTNLEHLESRQEISIQMDREISFIDCKVFFSSEHYFIGNKVHLCIALFSSLPSDISNITFQLKFINSYYDQHCAITDDNTVCLKSNSLTKINFEFKPLLEDIGKELVASELILKYGKKQNVSFHWQLKKLHQNSFTSYALAHNEKLSFDKLRPLLSTKILEHQSKLNVECMIRNNSHHIYVNERSIIKLRLDSHENYPISNLQLSLKVVNSTDERVDQNFAWYAVKGDHLTACEEKFLITEKMNSNECNECQFILQLFTVGKKSILIDLCYDLLLESGEKIQFILVRKQVIKSIDCVQAFRVNNTVHNIGCNDTANIRVAEPFKLSFDIGNLLGKDPIEIVSMTPYFNPKCNTISHLDTVSYPIVLDETASLKQLYLLSCSIESSTPTSLGQFVLQWKCKDELSTLNGTNVPSNMLLNETTFDLPSVNVASSLIFVEMHLPEQCHARGPIMAQYIIHNRLDVDMMAEICMGSSDCFMISGNKLIKTCIKGNLFIEQTYILFPLLCGELTLPQLGITIHLAGQNSINVDYINHMISSTVKVLPQIRT